MIGSDGFVAFVHQDGVSFGQVNAGTHEDMFSLFCVSPVGWAVGSHGAMLLTTDGLSWAPGRSGVEVNLRAVAFASKQVGLAAGDYGTVIRSEDGGNSWARVSVPTRAALYAAAMAEDGKHAWVGGDYGVLLRSEDGGRSFVESIVGDGSGIRGIRFAADGQRGFLVTTRGSVFSTGDAGKSWSEVSRAPNALAALSVSADGERVVAVGARGLVWRSANGGQGWERIASGTERDLRAIGFADNHQEAWIVGTVGTVLHTRDGAATVELLAAPTALDLNSVEDEIIDED